MTIKSFLLYKIKNITSFIVCSSFCVQQIFSFLDLFKKKFQINVLNFLQKKKVKASNYSISKYIYYLFYLLLFPIMKKYSITSIMQKNLVGRPPQRKCSISIQCNLFVLFFKTKKYNNICDKIFFRKHRKKRNDYTVF